MFAIVSVCVIICISKFDWNRARVWRPRKTNLWKHFRTCTFLCLLYVVFVFVFVFVTFLLVIGNFATERRWEPDERRRHICENISARLNSLSFYSMFILYLLLLYLYLGTLQLEGEGLTYLWKHFCAPSFVISGNTDIMTQF